MAHTADYSCQSDLWLWLSNGLNHQTTHHLFPSVDWCHHQVRWLTDGNNNNSPPSPKLAHWDTHCMHGWMDCWLLKVFQLLPWDEVLVATTLVMERASARARARACVCVCVWCVHVCVWRVGGRVWWMRLVVWRPDRPTQDLTEIVQRVARAHGVRFVEFDSFLDALRHHFRHITAVNDSPVFGERGLAFLREKPAVASALSE